MSTPSDMRRLGAVIVLGLAAGAGVRYFIESRARAVQQKPLRLIDWQQATRTALAVSQWEQAPVENRAHREQQYTELVRRSEPLIADYLGVQLPQPVERVVVVDRREWLQANIASFGQVFRPIEDLYQQHARHSSLSVTIGDLNSQFVGLQMGALLGFMARRVLGQYDLSLLAPEPQGQGTLYFVEPNIARVQQHLNLNDEQFRLWIALHETTHVFEFEAYPWVREHFNGLVRYFFDQMQQRMNAQGMTLQTLIEQFRTAGTGGKEHWLELMLTEEQRGVFMQLQALMALVEGYGNHVMNAIGAQLLPSFAEIERRMQQRKQNRTLLDQVIFKVTGLDLKMAQYQLGEAFVDAVVDARGIAFAARVWEGPEYLPTMDEIRNPQQWVARMDAVA